MKALELITKLHDAVITYGEDPWVEVYPYDEPYAGNEIWHVYLEGDTIRMSHS